MKAIDPLGDRGFLVRFDTESEASQWAQALRAEARPGILEIQAAYRTVALFADPDQLDLEALPGSFSKSIELPNEPNLGRELTIPVLYDGLDLEMSAQELGLTPQALIAAHTATPFDVLCIGFLPGFPYAGYLPQALSGLARLDRPRPRVPAGSVAIVGCQSAIYPQESPGGWRLIGRTPLCLVDLPSEYFPIMTGDRLRFQSVDKAAYQARLGERL